MEDYERRAQDFLEKTGTTITKEFKEYGPHFEGETDKRNIWSITLSRGYSSYTFRFGDSIVNTLKVSPVYYGRSGKEFKRTKQAIENLQSYVNRLIITPETTEDRFSKLHLGFNNTVANTFIPIPPDDYSILSCLQCEIYTDFQDFCDSFGYDSDSIKANKIYESCKEESLQLYAMYNHDEIDMLREIQ